MKTVRFGFDINGMYSAFEGETKVYAEHEGTYVSLEVAEGLLEALEEANLEIVYLHDKFATTGTGNSVLYKINAAIAKAKGE